MLYSFSEAGVKRAQIEEEHLVNARMAANLIFSDWNNDQPHLWAVDFQSFPLVQGSATYQLPSDTVLVLDAYLRTFQLPVVFNAAPNFSTVINTNVVTIGLTNHGLSPQNWLNINVPISVGGLILLGYYQVATVPNGNTFTILSGANATGTINNGGVVPQFTTTPLSSLVTVTFPNHGQLSGFVWNAPISTAVGGTTIQGAYTVQSVLSANQFTITVNQQAATGASAYENNGQAYIACQSVTAQPTDRILWPIGRSEYATYPNKAFQSPPSVFWFNRQISPTLTTYATPDGAGPYALNYYRVRQLQDVNATFAETIDVPDRFYDSFAAELSLRMAVIYDPSRVQMLEARRDRALGRAQSGDTEKVPIYISPSLGSYNRR